MQSVVVKTEGKCAVRGGGGQKENVQSGVVKAEGKADAPGGEDEKKMRQSGTGKAERKYSSQRRYGVNG